MTWIADQFPHLAYAEMAGRILAAIALAALFGLEREAKDKSAGLRTNVLVSLGACGFVLAVVQAPAILPVEKDAVEYDPTGLIAAVAGGIGFLGAGAIFNAGGDVKGLTTGAGIWLAGAIGVACGVGQIVLAATLSLLTLGVLIAFNKLEEVLFDKPEDEDPPPNA